MVSEERAQLMLVGAIAIAIVLIGLTLVLNSAVFTENVAGGRSSVVTSDIEDFDREAVRNVRSLTLRVNHEDEYETSGGVGGPGTDNLLADLRANVSSYSRLLGESYADTGSVYVNITYVGTEQLGYRIVQDDDANFSRNDGTSTWQPIDQPTSDTVEIGWFVMNVDVENVSQTDPVYVELTDAGGTELNVSMRRTSGGQLDVNSSIAGGNISDVTCQPQNGRVLLDVLKGTSYSGDCTFNSTEYLEPPYTDLRIVDGENGYGKYDVVVNDTVALTGVPACASPDEPCRAIAAWSVEFTTHYRTGSVVYERTHNVSVYDR